MTKQDVINKINQRTGQNPLTARAVLESFFKVVKHQVAAGESIQVRGFGSFLPVQRGAKVGRNINQKIALPIEARVIPVFKPSAEFKEQVRVQPVTKVTEWPNLDSFWPPWLLLHDLFNDRAVRHNGDASTATGHVMAVARVECQWLYGTTTRMIDRPRDESRPLRIDRLKPSRTFYFPNMCV